MNDNYVDKNTIEIINLCDEIDNSIFDIEKTIQHIRNCYEQDNHIFLLVVSTNKQDNKLELYVNNSCKLSDMKRVIFTILEFTEHLIAIVIDEQNKNARKNEK